MSSLFSEHLISCLIAVPFLGIALIALVPSTEWIRRVALASTLLTLALAALLCARFDPATEGMQFVERAQWMPTFKIQYAVGVDGISILLVLLTAFLTPLCVLCSWNAIDTRVRAFMILVLLVEGAMLVVFTALDMFLFFMSWEITMIPMYFLIILWGGPGRVAAGLKFVLYSLTGSLLLLVAILGLFVQADTFDILMLSERRYPLDVQLWIFGALLLAFAIKLPMIPFHSWLPDAHSEAPPPAASSLQGYC